jgi:serine/threonine protein kinase
VAIKCPKCHSENADTALYCSNCATSLTAPGEPGVSVTRTIETTTNELTRGTTFAGRYEIIEELGTGGMGRVYRAHDTKLNEEVALKLIKPEIAAERRVVERFRNELKTARKISHRNVCRMYDFHEEGKTLYLTMEYVRGEDLKSLIHRMKALTVGAAVSVARQVAEGLAEAHKLGIIHRDLKPGNIMIDKDGQAKIMDFGIARSLAGGGTTAEGAIIGTPEYMSPEQVEGKEADQRTDIYALGIILFEMVTGRLPFEGQTPFSIATKHKTEPPPIPKKLVPQIPEGLNKLILRCLDKDRAKRYQTAEELLLELGAVEAVLPITERSAASRSATKRRPGTSKTISVNIPLKKLVIPAVVLLCLIALLIFFIIPRLREKPIYPPPKENSFAVISFENQTGDKSQDHLQKVIPELLRTKFGQVGVSYVATIERMRELLKQSGKEGADFIGSDLGFELARRDGVKALVLGSFGKSGDTFVTTVRILDVETKRALATASAIGQGPDSILSSQIDGLCSEIFKKLEFSQAQLEKSKVPISEYTTSSPEAYKNYVLGEEASGKWKLAEAQSYYETAIKLDPSFALALSSLGGVMAYLGDLVKSAEYREKSWALSARLPEKERMSMEYSAAFASGEDAQRVLLLSERYHQKYPKDLDACYFLAMMYRSFLGRYEEAMGVYKEALELLHSNDETTVNEILCNYILAKDYKKAIEYANKNLAQNSVYRLATFGIISFNLGKLDEAIGYFEKVRGFAGLDRIVGLNFLQYIFALKEDWPESLKTLDAHASAALSPEMKLRGYVVKAAYESWLGRTVEATKTLEMAQRQVGDAGDRPEEQFNRSLVDWVRFWMAYDRNDIAECRKSLPKWPAFSGQMLMSKKYFGFLNVMTNVALELKEGKTELVKTGLTEMESLISTMGPVKMPFSSSTDAERARFLLGHLKSEALLAEGFPDKAVAALSQIPSPEPTDFQFSQFLIIYLGPFLEDNLARAYERMGEIDKAIEEYENLLRVDPKVGPRLLPLPIYRYRLAGLYERQGNKAKAVENFSKFLDLWKDADPGLTEVADARKRLAGLKGS